LRQWIHYELEKANVEERPQIAAYIEGKLTELDESIAELEQSNKQMRDTLKAVGLLDEDEGS
jgi:hypothetical protein